MAPTEATLREHRRWRREGRPKGCPRVAIRAPRAFAAGPVERCEAQDSSLFIMSEKNVMPLVKCESGRAMNGSYLTPDTHQRDLRATYMSDTPGRAVSTQNTRAPLGHPPITMGCAPDRAGGRYLNRVCVLPCAQNQAHATPAHATMLAPRATVTFVVHGWVRGVWGVWAPHSGTPDLLYNSVTLWAPHQY